METPVKTPQKSRSSMRAIKARAAELGFNWKYYFFNRDRIDAMPPEAARVLANMTWKRRVHP